MSARERFEGALAAIRSYLSQRRHPVPGSDPAEGAIVHEILDPGFLKARLEKVRREGDGLLSDERYAKMFSDLEQAEASPVSGADPSQGSQAYLPRSPAISILQSTLNDCVLSRADELLKRLPFGHRSYAEFGLADGDDMFRQFGPCDARWVESVLSKGLTLLEGDVKFIDGRAPQVTFADNARFVVVGDWGTGLPGARAVGRQMAGHVRAGRKQGREVHLLHLGDVYYSGWKEEYESRFMPYWPVRSAAEGVPSWALNGNHDMYSGGHGYFGYLLRDPRFAAQNGSSYFCLQNSHWQLLGLDTAFVNADLVGNQAEWVTEKLRESDRKTMLLTHHQPFSAYDPELKPPLLERLQPAFAVRKLDAWLWGHEHRCYVYDDNYAPYLKFGSCIGHGGVPVLLDDHTPPKVRWRAEGYEPHGDYKWQHFGFAVLDFHGAEIEIRYYDQTGGKPVFET
jgi:hypothetical protein